MNKFQKIQEEKRKQRNKELAKMIKNKEEIPPLANVSASWFPPRPIIKKDKKSLEQLFKKEKEEN